jgi:hypothetical protein
MTAATERLTIELAGVRLPALRLCNPTRCPHDAEFARCFPEWTWTAAIPLGETGRAACVQHYDPGVPAFWYMATLQADWEAIWDSRHIAHLDGDVVKLMDESAVLAQLQEWSR